jgi:hypothetical protein
MTRKSWVPIIAACLIAGCSSTSDPHANAAAKDSVSEGSLHFLSPDSGAPGFIVDTVRFYAVAGQDRSVSIYYQDSTPFMTFEVGPKSLALAAGDSVLITVAVADSSRLIVGFQPSGLTFVNGHPAQLTLSYAHAKDSLSNSSKSRLSLWGQENPGQQWHKVASSPNPPTQTVTGRIGGFTVYATAY